MQNQLKRENQFVRTIPRKKEVYLPILQEILGHFQNEQNIKGMILLRAFQNTEIKLQKIMFLEILKWITGMDFFISYLSISMSGTCSSRRPNFWLRVKQKISYAKLFSQIVSITFTKISDKFNHAVSFSYSDVVLFQIRFGNETQLIAKGTNRS